MSQPMSRVKAAPNLRLDPRARTRLRHGRKKSTWLGARRLAGNSTIGCRRNGSCASQAFGTDGSNTVPPELRSLLDKLIRPQE